ncbi:membrane protein [Gammaproteobacteria bacterium]|nr:membrane protein [Gammaproteobacteria bacterium]
MKIITALIAGFIFGLGLIISGMANPDKVLAFLDLAGDWDPSLALVMGGAIIIGLFAFSQAKSRKTSILGLKIQLPSATRIDKRLIIGALIFGIGWGLAGICPGPALVLASTGAIKGVVFVAAMLAGMLLFEILEIFFNKNSASKPETR